MRPTKFMNSHYARPRAEFTSDRRAFVSGSLSSAAAIAGALLSGEPVFAAKSTGVQRPFRGSDLVDMAKTLARAPYREPAISAFNPPPKLNYDEYRDIRFRAERAIWAGEGRNNELQLFAAGHLANKPVEIWIVEKGTARRLDANPADFKLGPLAKAKVPDAPHALSGFRIHAPINQSTYFDEYAVFQGASYFRAVARGQTYGASARGLAINTAQPGGEEFPMFRSFWIETPRKGADKIIVHALLDSKSIAGAYRFEITPGLETIMRVTATLFARTTIPHAGIAPLTSMFLFGPASRRITGDFRPAVHDNEGLAIYNGHSERIWRPLVNPKTLQTSLFLDDNLKGFGLIQRDRNFSAYQDLESKYERRPNAWIEPIGNWGRGHVELVEIPTQEEIHDNIVAYWKPKAPIEPGKPLKIAYRLRWTASDPNAMETAYIAKTRVGRGRKPGTTKFVIDIAGQNLAKFPTLPTANLSSPHAPLIGSVVIQRNPKIQGLRASFDIATRNVDLAELRLDLLVDTKPVCETWLYRWTKS